LNTVGIILRVVECGTGRVYHI